MSPCPIREVTPQTMKRISGALVGAIAFALVTAPSALAAAGYPESPTPSVEAASGANGSGTAFTGAGGGISMATIWIVVLVAAGVSALFVARRRAARLTSG
jgi:hypothetical protein